MHRGIPRIVYGNPRDVCCVARLTGHRRRRRQFSATHGMHRSVLDLGAWEAAEAAVKAKEPGRAVCSPDHILSEL